MQGLFSRRVFLNYPTKNSVSVIQTFLHTSGAGTDCRHDCPGGLHLWAELKMRAKESITNFFCYHRYKISLVSFSGCNTPCSYTEQQPGWNGEGPKTRSGRKAADAGPMSTSKETPTGKSTRDFSQHENPQTRKQHFLQLSPVRETGLWREKSWRCGNSAVWLHQ